MNQRDEKRGEGVTFYTPPRAPTSSHLFTVNLSLKIFNLHLPILTFYIGPIFKFWKLTPNHKWIEPMASEDHF